MIRSVSQTLMAVPMEEIFKKSPEKPREDSLITGTIIMKTKNAVYVDVPPFGTGLIFGREFLNARDILQEIKPGDTVIAKVVLPEGEQGYIELSLQEAKRAAVWAEAKKAVEQNFVFELPVKNANKGGLILEWQGIDGFLPASQLKTEHYPKVPDGNKDKIMEELKKLIGQTIPVYIISADPKENKLIFSEKTWGNKRRREILAKYNLGDVVEGEVTGVVDFGVFVKIEDGLEGLIHISEINWSLVENPRDLFKVGDRIQAKIIEVKDDRVSLSLKALRTNPWIAAAQKYKKDQNVAGVVIRHNRHGALVSIEEGVAGLVHISEFNNQDEELKKKLELGKTYPFIIKLFEPRQQRLILSCADATKTA